MQAEDAIKWGGFAVAGFLAYKVLKAMDSAGQGFASIWGGSRQDQRDEDGANIALNSSYLTPDLFLKVAKKIEEKQGTEKAQIILEKAGLSPSKISALALLLNWSKGGLRVGTASFQDDEENVMKVFNKIDTKIEASALAYFFEKKYGEKLNDYLTSFMKNRTVVDNVRNVMKNKSYLPTYLSTNFKYLNTLTKSENFATPLLKLTKSK